MRILRATSARVVLGALCCSLALTACGSGAEVGQDFAKQAASWPGVVEVHGGGSHDLPGGGSADAVITVDPNAPREVLEDLAKRSLSFAPQAAGPSSMSSVEIVRGADAFDVGPSEADAKQRIDALLAITGAPGVDTVQVGTSEAKNDLAVESAGDRCAAPDLYALAAHQGVGDGKQGRMPVIVRDGRGNDVYGDAATEPLNQVAWQLFSDLCDGSKPLVALSLVGNTMSFGPGLPEEREQAQQDLRALDTGSLELRFADESGYPRPWQRTP